MPLRSGPFVDDRAANIEAALKLRNLQYRRIDDIEPYMAGKLAQGKIAAWFQGRMESGPRALGNRSILMSANDAARGIRTFPYTASKMTRGRVLTICGSRGMTGAAIMSATFPNRIYQHAAQTDRLSNSIAMCVLPTIWDRLAERGLQGRRR